MSALDAAQAQISGPSADLSMPATNQPTVQAVNAVIPPPATPTSPLSQEKVAQIVADPTPKSSGSLKQLVVFVGIFVVLFTLAILIGYAIGYQQGQAG
jgi:hypothetical protein